MGKFISYNLLNLQDASIIEIRGVELNLPRIKPTKVIRSGKWRKRCRILERLRKTLGVEKCLKIKIQ